MPRSQAQAINEPNHKTWADYRKGCPMTFHGGYHDSEELSIFQHGMGTVFNLLEAEFPQPKEIFDNQPLDTDENSSKEIKTGESFFCVVCGRHLPIVDGVVVHDDIDHPKDMVFEPEAEKKHSHLISPTGC